MITINDISTRAASLAVFGLAAFGLCVSIAVAQEASPVIAADALVELDKSLAEAGDASSSARQRLALRRTIRDAEDLLGSLAGSPDRFRVLEFLFRARQRLVALDEDSQHRVALLETARELVKAPDELAELRIEADLLLSQAELAKQGADAAARAEALRPFVARYIDTPAGARVVRIAMVMALELGDTRLVNHLRQMIEQRFAADLEMIAFQRDKLGGQVFGAPFRGTFERSDGKILRFPMDALGRSMMCLFWSNDEGGMEVIKRLAAAAIERKDELDGRLEIISFNLDELPDAGESILRGLGVDWHALRLPGGRKNPIYDAYVRSDPRWLTVSPTGQAAMIMSGSTRRTNDTEQSTDYTRVFQSALAREWTQPRYVQQFASLTAGDFLVLDPLGAIDPARPPEWKALATGEAAPLPRAANAVPEETLRSIQACFIPGPQRYRMPHTEACSAYTKAAELCRQAIAAHPQAPDLWIVRNRLLVALMGLWKADADLARFEEAVAVAQTAVEAGCPPGCDVIPRFVLAREALRQPDADPQAVIDRLVDGSGKEPSGPALAAAALLCLDVADRRGFERYRERILKAHTENPMMWIFSAFLLDRYHRYWLFQVPFTAGWSYGRRENYFLSRGEPESAERRLQAEFQTLDGEPVRIPQRAGGTWTVVAFIPPPADGKNPHFAELARYTVPFINSRPLKDVELMATVIGGDAASIRASLGEKPPEFPVFIIPDGIANPLVPRLGIVSEDERINYVVVRPDGTITATASGLVRGGRSIPQNVIEWHDEQAVSEAIDCGDLDKAKKLIFSLAPPFDPEAVDEKGRKLKQPQFSLAHLRARARVYAAMEEWEKALADAEEVVQSQLGTDGGMSLRTDELDESEALRDQIRIALDASRKEP